MRRFSMPRLSTLLITVAVAALAVVAIVFSVISSLDSSPRQEAASTSQEQADSGEVPSPADAEGADDISGIQTRDELVTELAQANLSGTLAIAQRETCRVFKLSLPYLQARKEPDLEACSFPVVSDPRLSPTAEARQPNGVLVASCREGRLSVFDRLVTQHPPPNEQIARRYSIEGCAPAWRSDGALTFVRGGEVVSASPGCLDEPDCAQVLLPRAALAAGLRVARPTLHFDDAKITQLVWTGPTRFVAIIDLHNSDGTREDLVGLVDRTRLIALARPRAPKLSLIRVSPKRTYVAVRAPGTQALWVFRPRADRLEVKRFPPWAPPAPTDINGIAWSPDERWTVVSSRRSIYLFQTGKSRLGYIGLPLVASDVLWQ